MKWASLPEHLRRRIEEDDRRHQRGGNSLQRKTPLQASTRFGVGKGIQGARKRLQRGVGNESGAPKRYAPATFRDGTCLRKRSRKAVRVEAARRKWRERIFQIHGERCIYPGCTSTGPFDVAHAYSKGAYPEWHVMDWNGFPSCRRHHTGKDDDCFEFTPHLKRALMECADEMRAAYENRRPQPSWEELQAIITRAIRENERRQL